MAEGSKSRVALVRGEDRYRNIRRALELLTDEVDLSDKKRIVVKPNFVTVHRRLAATHREAVRAVLAFLRERGAREITLAEGPALGSLGLGLWRYGYRSLVDEFGLRVVNLNKDETVEVELLNRQLQPMRLPVARTIVESDFRVSVGPPKTHDTVIVTLSLKNMAVGSIPGSKKGHIHQGYPGINLNLYRMAYHVAPHLAVLDGFQAMEGNGPVSGRPVDWRIAIASTDFLAADGLALHLMGFKLEDIGYLYYCQLKGLGHGRLEEMEIVGNVEPEEVWRQFVRHSEYERQLAWRIPDFERYL
ncbi:MAG: DUF362 domain-containing protein [Anaerolineae bacterium]|nr:DUF362 domain-containing protein [Anaerolineae bacterium]